MRKCRIKIKVDCTATVKAVALERAYKRAVSDRTGKPCFVKVDRQKLLSVARGLKSSRLATLWVESQFHSMPSNWCVVRFKTKYPPVNVVFSDVDSNWIRYHKYIRGKG